MSLGGFKQNFILKRFTIYITVDMSALAALTPNTTVTIKDIAFKITWNPSSFIQLSVYNFEPNLKWKLEANAKAIFSEFGDVISVSTKDINSICPTTVV